MSRFSLRFAGGAAGCFCFCALVASLGARRGEVGLSEEANPDVLLFGAAKDCWLDEVLAVSVVTREAVESAGPAPGVPGPSVSFDGPSLPVLSTDTWDFDFGMALKISRGKSAIAILILPISPSKAEVTAEIGSHGSSPVLYSFPRKLAGC